MRIGLEALMQAMEEPCRIQGVLHTQPSEPGLPWKRSYLKTVRLPLCHVDHCFGGRFEALTPVPASYAADYDNCLHWSEGLPAGARGLIGLLTEALVLPTGDDARLDLAMALDWYKVLDPAVPSTEWDNTRSGELVYRAKYWTSSPSTRRAAAGELIDLLSAAVDRHPAYRDAPVVVSVPGSKGDGNSVGEYIAFRVAERTGKELVKTTGPAREPRKSGGASGGLDGQFALPTTIEGACIVVDDVYRSGITMRATALAARQAGATAVFGLAAAKTISG